MLLKKMTVRHLLVLSVLMLTVTSAQAAFFEDREIVVKDLAFGEILYEFYQKNYFTATTKLLIARELGRVPNHKKDADLMLGGLYLSYGLHLEAEAVFGKLIADGTDPLTQDKAWFNLAKVRYQKGQHDDAIRAIEEIGDNLPVEQKNDVSMMMTNLLMQKGQYDDAIALLKKSLDNKEISEFARFNLGVALFKQDNQIEGAEQLDIVGHSKSAKSDVKALRDKANIALGYALLAAEDPVKAKAYFQLVRVNGPFSNKALLGLGWANAMQKEYQKAMAPWIELSRKKKTESAVYESLLAVAYGLEQLQAYRQSIQAYQDAIITFKTEEDSIDNALAAVRDNAMWDQLFFVFTQKDAQHEWSTADLPVALEARFLNRIVASNEFHEAMKNLRDMSFLHQNLQKWAHDIPAYQDMLALRKSTYEKRLPELATDQGVYRLAAFRDERNLYREEMDRIVRDGDIIALATDKERDQIDRLEKLKLKLRSASTRMDPGKYNQFADKYRLYRGLLEWDIGTTIKTRQWNINKSLRMLDRELQKTDYRQKELQRAKYVAPRGFEGHGQQIDYYGKRIEELSKDLVSIYDEQKEDLQLQVVSELVTVRNSLTEYLDQAQFALARLQDLASQEKQP